MIPTVPKPFQTAPIGRCNDCGVTTYDMDALNFRCEQCGGGIVASVAMPDWRPCPACFGTGKSCIATDTAEGNICPVCQGTGWITEAEYPLAEDEMQCAHVAVDNALDEPGSRHVPVRYSFRSLLGSVPLLIAKVAPRALQAKLMEYSEIIDKYMSRNTGDDDDDDLELIFMTDDDISAAVKSNVRFLSGKDLTGNSTAKSRVRYLTDADLKAARAATKSKPK